MAQLSIYAAIAAVLLILGIVVGKIGSNKGKPGVIVISAFVIVAAFCAGFMTYETYMQMPIDYTIVAHEETASGYKIQLSSGGSINTYIVVPSKYDLTAKDFATIEMDKDGNDVIVWNSSVALSREDRNKFLSN